MSLPAVSRLFRTALRTRVIPAANLTTKPAKVNLSAAEQAIGITAFLSAILIPSFWVLAHIDDYKKKA
ncbi:cytochrome c oxidase subunit 8B, mitochondrial [Poeciliopsis prolifica]|uniref:cytochrome c oxidase subunit 8B, mitochondrial n=1 Tax=Poeciliopsis prolifica TaxID=188132 RepID=UPI0024136765|nr:cytochrome c oxidase subunit 8B, mitochondrial [Poeciliopsis prolifica]